MSQQEVNTKIIHQHVVALLIAAKYSPITAERKWDEVYSVQLNQAKPGQTITWIIGDQEIEIKKGGTDA